MAKCIKTRKGTPNISKTKVINVYGAVNETITIGDYSCVTDEDGVGTMEVQKSDLGKSYTPTCSVSNWSTAIELSLDTYCRPANIIYWYGATDDNYTIEGGYHNYNTSLWTMSNDYAVKQTNRISLTSSSPAHGGISFGRNDGNYFGYQIYIGFGTKSDYSYIMFRSFTIPISDLSSGDVPTIQSASSTINGINGTTKNSIRINTADTNSILYLYYSD